MKNVGFLVNPIAGMGGRVGLKGTDGKIDEAMALGASNVSFERARQFFSHLGKDAMSSVRWHVCASPMGEDLARGGVEYEVAYRPKGKTTGQDTMDACRRFAELGCDLIVFCGGDGTARDVFSVVGDTIPILGIPSGVKMLSGVFAINPSAAAEMLDLYARGETATKDAEIVDLDEEEYRKDNFAFKVFGIGITIFEGNYIQSAKVLIRGAGEEDVKHDIARTVIEDMDDGTLYLLGAGSTLKVVGDGLGIKKTLLGIDAVISKALVASDLNEDGLMSLLSSGKEAKLILSPIGAQGFILGRGNLQLSPRVIREIGLDNILIVSTPAKLKTISHLLVDSGDANLDEMFYKKRYLPVIIGYRTTTIKNIGIQNL